MRNHKKRTARKGRTASSVTQKRDRTAERTTGRFHFSLFILKQLELLVLKLESCFQLKFKLILFDLLYFNVFLKDTHE